MSLISHRHISAGVAGDDCLLVAILPPPLLCSDIATEIRIPIPGAASTRLRSCGCHCHCDISCSNGTAPEQRHFSISQWIPVFSPGQLLLPPVAVSPPLGGVTDLVAGTRITQLLLHRNESNRTAMEPLGRRTRQAHDTTKIEDITSIAPNPGRILLDGSV